MLCGVSFRLVGGYCSRCGCRRCCAGVVPTREPLLPVVAIVVGVGVVDVVRVSFRLVGVV